MRRIRAGIAATGALVTWSSLCLAIEAPDEYGAGYDVNDVSRMAIADSLGVRILRLEEDAERESKTIARSIYDTVWTAGAGYKRDEKPGLSVFSPDRSEETIVETGLSKSLPAGTAVTFSWMSQKGESDSNFVTLNPSFSQTVSVGVTQPLLKNSFGFIDRLRLEKTDLEFERFSFKTLRSIEAHVSEARRAFWTAVEAENLFAIRRQSLEDAKEFYRVAQEKLKLGLLEEPDDYAARAFVTAREIEVLEAQNRAVDDLNELKLILSLPLETALGLEAAREAKDPDSDREEFLREARGRRFDLREALLDAKNRELAVKIHDNDIWPRLDLEAGMDLNGLGRTSADTWNSAWDGDTPTYTFLLTLEHPFENRSAMGRLRQARFEKMRALAFISQLEATIKKEVDEAYREVAIQRERLIKMSEIMALHKNKLAAETRRFEQGRSSADLMIRYQDDFLRAQDQHARTITAHEMAVDDLRRVTGGLLEPYLNGGEGRR